MKEIQASDEEIEQFNISQNQLSSNMIIQEDALKLRVENEQLKVQIERLEKEKCELLGLIQAKDKLIEKIKHCTNCKFKINEEHCGDCDEDYSNWRLAE